MSATSSAKRVSKLLAAAARIDDKQASMAVFPKLFDLTEVKPDNLQQDVVYEALNDLRAQIRVVEQGLSQEEKEVSDVAIRAAYNFTSFSNLHISWNTQRSNYLRAEVLRSWSYIAVHFRDKADEIPAEEFKTLTDELNDLEKAASADGVPDDLRQFIGEQIDRIRRAMRRYKVIGHIALREAVRAGYGDAVCTVPSMDKSTPAAKEALGKLGKVWEHTATVAKDAKAIHDIIALLSVHGQGIAQIASNVAERIG